MFGKALLVSLLLVSNVAAAQSAPTEFVTQILEPTGGKIQKPKDWFYAEQHQGPRYAWTLSKENTADNAPYTTGVRIQMFLGVQKGTGKTPERFLRDFAERRAAAGNVVKTCSASDQGLFTRLCLEVEEGDFHVLYSMFWLTDGGDLAVVSSAGTTKALWTTYAPTFEKMSDFEIIDMRRFTP